jgi:hypothetical protein
MSALGTVLGWVGAAERVVRLVRLVLPRRAAQVEGTPLSHKDVSHQQAQIRSAARPYPPPTPPPPRPMPPPRRPR